MRKRPPKITERDYWPTILERLSNYALQGMAPTTAAGEIAKEFGCEMVTIYHTMQRGDVPSYPSTDRARAEAWAEGRTRYIRGLHCQKCGERVFVASDGRCVNCDKAWVRKHREDRLEKLSASEESGDFYTGLCLFADDKVLFSAQTSVEPFKRGSKIHEMASAMLGGPPSMN